MWSSTDRTLSCVTPNRCRSPSPPAASPTASKHSSAARCGLCAGRLDRRDQNEDRLRNLVHPPLLQAHTDALPRRDSSEHPGPRSRNRQPHRRNRGGTSMTDIDRNIDGVENSGRNCWKEEVLDRLPARIQVGGETDCGTYLRPHCEVPRQLPEPNHARKDVARYPGYYTRMHHHLSEGQPTVRCGWATTPHEPDAVPDLLAETPGVRARSSTSTN